MSTSRPPGPSVTLDDATCYAALAARDASCIGAFFVGVTTTGIFCRPGCPARTPRRDHCEFFPAAADAMRAGYRPCRRCTPLVAPPPAPAWAMALMRRMDDHPAQPLTADYARELGVHPATAARFFKSRLGATFQQLSRARRVGVALSTLRGAGGSSNRAAGRSSGGISRALAASGFTSESGFRKAVEELFGTTPAEAARRDVQPTVARWMATPLGPMVAAASDVGVCLLEFTDRRMLATNLRAIVTRIGRPIAPGDNAHLRTLERELGEYFTGRRTVFRTPLHTGGTAFQESVWQALREIPHGETRSYANLAARIGRPTAVRAVAAANGANRIAILIPCHRVIGSDGTLVGYGGGVWRKRTLLEVEGVACSEGA